MKITRRKLKRIILENKATSITKFNEFDHSFKTFKIMIIAKYWNFCIMGRNVETGSDMSKNNCSISLLGLFDVIGVGSGAARPARGQLRAASRSRLGLRRCGSRRPLHEKWPSSARSRRTSVPGSRVLPGRRPR